MLETQSLHWNPFKLTFNLEDDNTKMDADGGMWAVYGLKYEIDGDKGISFKHAGVNFVQHLTSNTHQNQLHIFSAQMTPHIAKFSAKIAVIQSEIVGDSSSSSKGNLVELDECAISCTSPVPK